jgi:hypothetical protein
MDETIFKLKGAVVSKSGSQVRFAREYRIEDTRLNRILNGWIEPRPEEVLKLRKALGPVIDEVLEGRKRAKEAAG